MGSQEQLESFGLPYVEEDGVTLEQLIFDFEESSISPPHTTLAHKRPGRSFSGTSTTSSQSTGRSSHLSRSFSSSSVSTMSNTPHGCGYDLPCEFQLYTACDVRFHGLEVRPWISHLNTHFDRYLPPPKSLCIFCDNVSFESPSRSRRDLSETWTRRMMHILEHIRALEPLETSRPDFFVVKYLWENGLMDEQDYTSAIGYSERPEHFNHRDLVPRPLGTKSSKTQKMKEDKKAEKKERRSQEAQKFEKEERLLRRETRKGRKWSKREDIGKGSTIACLTYIFLKPDALGYEKYVAHRHNVQARFSYRHRYCIRKPYPDHLTSEWLRVQQSSHHQRKSWIYTGNCLWKSKSLLVAVANLFGYPIVFAFNNVLLYPFTDFILFLFFCCVTTCRARRLSCGYQHRCQVRDGNRFARQTAFALAPQSCEGARNRSSWQFANGKLSKR